MDAGLSEFFEWGFKAMMTGLVAVGFKSNSDAHKKAEAAEKSLAEHKLEVAEKYAKTDSVQKSFERLDDRIDEVSQDIKTLLQRVK